MEENTPQEPSSSAEPKFPSVPVSGILDIDEVQKNGTLLQPQNCGKVKPADPFVPRELIQKLKLKKGSWLDAQATADPRFKNPKVRFVDKIDGLTIDERRQKTDFLQLTTITPDEQLKLETADGRMTTRAIDLFCPIGKGQRGLIVAPPRTGKTTLLRDIAMGVFENNPDCHVMVVLVDERPEEVTDLRRSLPKAELYASSNDEPLKNHLRVAELAVERAKRLVEVGKDVVILLDSLTRLSRAYNSARGGGGRTMSGGLDIRALEKPRQLFSAARNTEEAGSLTIIASALIETGSRMDDLIFQEFKGTGNMEMVLDRRVAELRLWPAINIASSGTRREELLIPEKDLTKHHFFRRAVAGMKPDEAAETALGRMAKTKSNKELLALFKV
jgi:transcription termination factor Rho